MPATTMALHVGVVFDRQRPTKIAGPIITNVTVEMRCVIPRRGFAVKRGAYGPMDFHLLTSRRVRENYMQIPSPFQARH